MDAHAFYNEWLEYLKHDQLALKELKAISDDNNEIRERFSFPLQFGTGGVRAILGMGRNRINNYTICRITEGVANYLKHIDKDAHKHGVVIAYDPRNLSKQLAIITASTFIAGGIKAYVFPDIRPTPLLSYSVRELGAIAGIVITASHNPPEYNGYKVYGQDGGQIVPEVAEQIYKFIQKVPDFYDTPLQNIEQHKQNICWLDEKLDNRYIDCLKLICNSSVHHPKLPLVYTPLHGAGNILVQRILKETNFAKLHVVIEQAEADAQFSTVTSPNPEEREAFTYAKKLAYQVDAECILATDPDCDRVGVMARDSDGEYQYLSGNQVGALLLNYLLSKKSKTGELTANGIMIKTVVTGDLGKKIATHFNVETIETLTGFKYIGEQIELLEDKTRFMFGYEESCGYLTDTFVRDKDGVLGVFLIASMAAEYYNQGKSLLDQLEELHHFHGYFQEKLVSRSYTGIAGMEKMREIMNHFRQNIPTTIGKMQIDLVRDFLHSNEINTATNTVREITLPSADSIQFVLSDGSWFCLRPSGTEPKLKIYFSVTGKTDKKCTDKLDMMVEDVLARVK